MTDPNAILGKSEHEYCGWKIRITHKPVDSRHSALIEVCGPGQDPQTHGTRAVEFSKRAASWEEARDAAFETAKAWIDQVDPRGPKEK
jgi:hypothetical protein